MFYRILPGVVSEHDDISSKTFWKSVIVFNVFYWVSDLFLATDFFLYLLEILQKQSVVDVCRGYR